MSQCLLIECSLGARNILDTVIKGRDESFSSHPPGTSDLVEKGGKEPARGLAPDGHFSSVLERTAQVLAICCAPEKKNVRNQQTLLLK